MTTSIDTITTRQIHAADAQASNSEARALRAQDLASMARDGYALVSTITVEEGDSMVILDTLTRANDG